MTEQTRPTEPPSYDWGKRPMLVQLTELQAHLAEQERAADLAGDWAQSVVYGTAREHAERLIEARQLEESGELKVRLDENLARMVGGGNRGRLNGLPLGTLTAPRDALTADGDAAHAHRERVAKGAILLVMGFAVVAFVWGVLR